MKILFFGVFLVSTFFPFPICYLYAIVIFVEWKIFDLNKLLNLASLAVNDALPN